MLSTTATTSLLAAIPPLFGFVPTNSIVFVGIRNAHLALTQYLDLADVAGPVMRSGAESLATHGIDSVFVIVVSDAESDLTTVHPALRIADDLLHYYAPSVAVLSLTQVESLAGPGHRWVDHLTGIDGVTDDYRASEAATAAVMSGKPIVESRAAVEACFARDHTRQATRVDSNTVDAVEVVRAVIAAMHDTTLIDERLAANVAALIRFGKNRRDALLRTIIYNDEEAAEVYTRCAAMLSGQDRVDVLTLSAVANYCAGNCMRVSMAIEAAEAETATYNRLLQLTRSALDADFAPQIVRSVLDVVDDEATASELLGGSYPPYE